MQLLSSRCSSFAACLQTMLGRAGGLTVLQSRGDRYSVLPGDKLKFGTLDTFISYGAVHEQVSHCFLSLHMLLSFCQHGHSQCLDAIVHDCCCVHVAAAHVV